jgi:hypothetical protein
MGASCVRRGGRGRPSGRAPRGGRGLGWLVVGGGVLGFVLVVVLMGVVLVALVGAVLVVAELAVDTPPVGPMILPLPSAAMLRQCWVMKVGLDVDTTMGWVIPAALPRC